MIHDLDAIASLRQEWDSLRRTQENLKINVNAASLVNGAWFLQQIADSIYALLLPFGFSVLEHVLQQMRDEGAFSTNSSQLKALMVASQSQIPWSDFRAIDQGREVRNKLTHEQVIPGHVDTFRILDQIEREFIGWKVLDGPVKYEFTLTVGGGT